MTGDGGWALFDRALAGSLSSKGISVVGWDSRQYYASQRSPDEAAQDLHRIIVHYRSIWKKDRVALIGYSFGADVLPFLINRLDSADFRSVDCIAFL